MSCNVSTIGALLEHDEVSVADVLDLNKAACLSHAPMPVLLTTSCEELLDATDDADRDKAFKDFLDSAASTASTHPSLTQSEIK